MAIFKTTGTCAKEIHFTIEDNIITDIQFIGGCPGSLTGIASLVKGMDVETVIERFKGVNCGSKSTSCPDQLAEALKGFITQAV